MNLKLKYSIRRVSAIAVALTLGLASAAGVAQAQTGAKSFIWKVNSGARVMYLAGSVHLLSADMYPLNPAFEQAFAASDTLFEEIDLGQAGLMTLAPLMLSKGMYQDGRTFNKVVSKETADLVTKRLKGSPIPPELIGAMKPWMVMLVLSALQAEQAGLNAELGLDKYFYDKATAMGKPVVGLETAEAQFDSFDRVPESVQEQMLRSTLEEMDADKAELAATVTAWRRGDAAALERILLNDFKKYPAAYQSLIVQRNNNWMPALEKCLTKTTPCMVVVGAAHLIGPDGLLALLQRKGYRVEQQ